MDPWVGKIPLEKEMPTHSSILAYKIPRTEESGGMQSMGLQGVRHDRVTEHRPFIMVERERALGK